MNNESNKAAWIAGYNQPGYMPDNEPHTFDTWEEGNSYITAGLERAAEEAGSDDIANAMDEFRAAWVSCTPEQEISQKAPDGYVYWLKRA